MMDIRIVARSPQTAGSNREIPDSCRGETIPREPTKETRTRSEAYELHGDDIMVPDVSR
jgi:hypothetical protein